MPTHSVLVPASSRERTAQRNNPKPSGNYLGAPLVGCDDSRYLPDLHKHKNEMGAGRSGQGAVTKMKSLARTTYHFRLSVRGALKNQSFDGLLHNDGRQMTREEAFTTLRDSLKAGHEYIPMGDCDNWDDEKGCLGHPDT